MDTSNLPLTDQVCAGLDEIDNPDQRERHALLYCAAIEGRLNDALEALRMLPLELPKHEPLPDLACCSSCNWSGPADKCETKWEQDGWEGTPYQIHLCPKCEDGGCIDNYDMSSKQLKRWNAWAEANGQTPI